MKDEKGVCCRGSGSSFILPLSSLIYASALYLDRKDQGCASALAD